jgi:hypothetical protein
MENLLSKLHNTGDGIFELVFTDGERLDSGDLMILNSAGYVFVNNAMNVDYEDEVNGETVTRYMDIYYFGKVNVKQFSELLEC